MAENQKVHPTPLAATFTSSLVSRRSFRTGKVDPIPAHSHSHSHSHPDPHSHHTGVIGDAQQAAHVHVPEQANQHATGAGPPLRHYSLPEAHHALRPPKSTGSGFCCRCICCTFFLVFTFIFIIAILALAFYLIFRPKVPKYSVERLKITDLRLNTDLSLYARFNVRIKAANPNDKIGIYYEKGGRISVWYPNTQTELCNGPIPVFYQGHQNTTVLDVALTGQNQYGSAFLSALQQQQQQTGNVPLELKVDAAVAVKLGSLKLRKVKFFVTCSLLVDSLTSNNLVSIRTSNCSLNFKL